MTALGFSYDSPPPVKRLDTRLERISSHLDARCALGTHGQPLRTNEQRHDVECVCNGSQTLLNVQLLQPG